MDHISYTNYMHACMQSYMSYAKVHVIMLKFLHLLIKIFSTLMHLESLLLLCVSFTL
jgi:hypothetical protein